MNKQNLIIYDFIELFSILNEIKNNLNFKLLNISKNEFSELELDDLSNFLVITKNKVPNVGNQIVFDNYPLRISKIIENININFLKNSFSKKSDIDLGLQTGDGVQFLNITASAITASDIKANSMEVISLTSSFITASTIVTTGSNVFGDSSSDTHTFIGDIIESIFKRLNNLKNSSNYLPGHGGFFDRFDSFIFAIFPYYIFTTNIL